MKIFFVRIFLAFLFGIFSQACTQDTDPKTKQGKEESVKILAASELPLAKNGYYELAEILAWTMLTSDSSLPLRLSASPQGIDIEQSMGRSSPYASGTLSTTSSRSTYQRLTTADQVIKQQHLTSRNLPHQQLATEQPGTAIFFYKTHAHGTTQCL